MIWTTQPRSEGPGGLHYWCEGTGPALVLIHGVGLRAEAWAGMMPALSAHFTVYALDLPGHGCSPLRNATDLADYARHFDAFLDTLKGPVRLVGHSMGAMIALHLAVHRGTQIAGVAALCAIYQRDPKAAKAVAARAQALIDAPAPDPTQTLRRWFGSTPQGDTKEANTACHHWLTHANLPGYRTAYSIFAHHDGPPPKDLTALQCPALFLTGEHDANSTPDMSRAMADLAPAGRFEVVHDAAHMAPMTHPQVIAAAILACFDSPDIQP